MTDEQRPGSPPAVGVWPGTAAHDRSALLEALSLVAEVRFVPVADSGEVERGLCGLIAFAPPGRAGHVSTSSRLPTLTLSGEGAPPQPGSVSFTNSRYLDHRLRGAVLPGEWSPGAVGTPHRDGEVLATVGAHPVWIHRREQPLHHVLSVGAPELGRGEYLRDRIVSGRCLALVGLIQFLRTVAEPVWSRPPVHASFMVDDPNLRRPTYGYIDFAELLTHSARCNYHMGFATIPLDLRVSDRRTVSLFRSAPDRLSLTIHGNNHTGRELAAPASAAEADRLLAQALGRASRFEARTGLSVNRIMVPPHEACSMPVMKEMPRRGFEAVSMTRAYGWRTDLESTSPYAAPGDPAAGFGPTQVTEFGTPVLIRRDFSEHQEAPLRAFLDQPIILFGHVGDFRDGLGLLENVSALVNQLPGVVWSDISTLSRSCYLTRRSGDELHVKPFARRINLTLAPDVRTVVMEPLVGGGQAHDELTLEAGERSARVFDRARSRLVIARGREAAASLAIELVTPASIEIAPAVDRWRASWGTLRRVATEARDRSQPLRENRGPTQRASARADTS